MPALYTPDAGLRAALRRLGYPAAGELQGAGLLLTSEVTPEVVAYVREGGRALVLADRAPAAPCTLLPKVRLMPREGAPWDGDWASSFTWLKRSGPFAALPGGPLIDHSFDAVIPETVMTGFGDWDYQASVHAGLVVGWVHRPAALIAERRYGQGRAVMNTFRLGDALLGSDPTATALFDGLVSLALRP
jgi:hypothetical protein